MQSPEERQRAYYAERAADYDDHHLHEGDGHFLALPYVVGLMRQLGARSALDVGAGTGRTLVYLSDALPDVDVRGIEPVPELAAAAHAKGVSPERLTVASGEALPFEDGAIDCVMSTGVLHHVREPARVIAEMTRVARRAVFISDSNRFGQGRPVVRLAKLGLKAAGLWRAFDLLRTRGKGYMESEGDGLYYSYSFYDDLPQLRAWADRVFVIPFQEDPRTSRSLLGLAGPLLNAPQGLVCAIKDADV